MSFLDSIGGALGGAAQAVENVGEEAVGMVSKIPDPIAMGIEKVGGMLGLDPKIIGLAETAVGAMTGDVMCAIHGVNDIVNSKDPQSAPPPGSTGPAPGVDPGYAAPVLPDLHDALQTVRDHFAELDADGDGTITKSELDKLADGPPSELQRAAMELSLHTDVCNEMSIATRGGKKDFFEGLGNQGDPNDVKFSLSALDEELTKIPKSEVPVHGAAPAPAPSSSAPTGPATQGAEDTKKPDAAKAADGADDSGASDATSDATQFDQDINDIMNDPHLSMEEKVLAILMKLEERAEKTVHDKTQKLVDMENSNDKNANDKTKQQSTQGVEMELQQAMSKMNELQSMASNFEKAFHETASAVINNIR